MKDMIKRIASDPLGLMGLVLVALTVISALFAGLIAPYDPVQLNIMDRLQGPSVNPLLGTDQLGRDLFSRVLYGGQVALKVALISIGIALGIGVLLGMLVSPWFLAVSGFVGGGLIFAGLSGWCGMAKLLARMPWNRPAWAASRQQT